MIKSSNAVLALWNGFSANPAEYNTWHTQEHVLERLTVPGFLSARRYVRERGPLPEYLTLYWLANAEALTSGDYLKLLQSPSGWSQTMRNGLTDVLRKVCVDVSNSGRGIGGAAFVKLLSVEPAMVSKLRAFQTRPEGQAITSFTLGAFECGIADLPFETETYSPPESVNGFLLVEGFDSARLEALVETLDQDLHGLTGTKMQWTHYRLAFIAGNEDALTASERAQERLMSVHSLDRPSSGSGYAGVVEQEWSR